MSAPWVTRMFHCRIPSVLNFKVYMYWVRFLRSRLLFVTSIVLLFVNKESKGILRTGAPGSCDNTFVVGTGVHTVPNLI